MKKIILACSILLIVFTTVCSVNKSKTSTPQQQQGTLKARFEISALCANYTFSVIEGNIDTALVVESWVNPQTNKVYKNAFGISNPCSLPKNLKQGDEFYFEIDKTASENCAVCMAYYPTPQKHLSIKVLNITKK